MFSEFHIWHVSDIISDFSHAGRSEDDGYDVEQHKTAKWLAEQMEKDPATISKWCTNKAQPSLETIKKIAEILQVKMSDLVSNEQPL